MLLQSPKGKEDTLIINQSGTIAIYSIQLTNVTTLSIIITIENPNTN